MTKEIDAIQKENKDVMSMICKNWKKGLEVYHKLTPAKVPLTPIIKKATDIEFSKITTDIMADKVGEYTINPDLNGVDFSSIAPEKIKAINLDNMNGKPLYEVAEHVVKNYGATHYIPDLRFIKWVLFDLSKKDQKIKSAYKHIIDGSENFIFGSIVRGPKGIWRVPEIQHTHTLQAFSSDYAWKGESWEWRAIVIEK
jgi:hypothetical protein